MAISSPQEKFEHELTDIYDAEHQFLDETCMRVQEASKMMEEAGTSEICDAIILSAATKAEHYEMVSYKDLVDGATMLKMRGAARLLTENRDEEVKTARKLERAAPRIEKAAA